MTFDELQSEFYSRGFEYLSDTGGGQTRAKRWINNAYMDICDEYPWDFLRAEETGDGVVSALAVTDLGKVIAVTDITNQNVLIPVPETIIAAVDWDPQASVETSGSTTPMYWYINSTGAGASSAIYPWPLPDNVVVLKVVYHKIPTELSTGTDEPLLPSRFHQLIVDGAVIKAFVDNEAWESVAALKQKYQEDLDKMVASLGWRSLQYSPTVLDSGPSGDW